LTAAYVNIKFFMSSVLKCPAVSNNGLNFVGEKEGNLHYPYAMAVIDINNRVLGYFPPPNISRLLFVSSYVDVL
jgi:hypothetical protein